jgi:hypothetical protein
MRIYCNKKSSDGSDLFNKVKAITKKMVAVEKNLNPEQEDLRGFPSATEMANEILEYDGSIQSIKDYLDDTKELFKEAEIPDDKSDPDWQYTWKYLHQYEDLYNELLTLLGK